MIGSDVSQAIEALTPFFSKELSNPKEKSGRPPLFGDLSPESWQHLFNCWTRQICSNFLRKSILDKMYHLDTSSSSNSSAASLIAWKRNFLEVSIQRSSLKVSVKIVQSIS